MQLRGNSRYFNLFFLFSHFNQQYTSCQNCCLSTNIRTFSVLKSFFSVVHVKLPVITMINTVTDAQSGKSVYLENRTGGKEPCLSVG